MLRIAKRFALELLLLLCACAVGALIWIAIASSYEGASDAFWSANGHPPPPDMFRAPDEWRFVILFAPYLLVMALRLVVKGARRRWISAAA